MIKSKKLFARALYLVFALALVAGLTLVPAVAAAPDYVGVSLVEVGDGIAEWSTEEANSGSSSVLLGAGTLGGANAGRIQVEVAPIPIADFTGASYFVWEPDDTEHGGQVSEAQEYPYGDPYINILIDLDNDGVSDDKLEGVGSVAVPAPEIPITPHPAPTPKTWVEMEEGYGFYDMDNSMGQGTWIAWPIVVGSLSDWKTYLATEYPDAQVVGVQITFGFWADDVTPEVYVDDITINGVTYDLEKLFINSPTTASPAYTKSGQWVTVEYTLQLGGPFDVAIEILKDATVIASKSESRAAIDTPTQFTTQVYIGTGKPTEWYDIKVNVFDQSDDTTDVKTEDNAVCVDDVDPTLDKDLDGTLGDNDWYTDDVEVTLTGSDDDSGVALTEYNLDDGGWTPYTVPFDITTEGENTLQHKVTDNAGNEFVLETQTIKIDKTDPTLVKKLNGEDPTGDWYTSDVTVTLTGDDATSLLARVEYSFDGTSWEPYTVPFTISTEGTTTLYHQAYDNAGNEFVLEQQDIKIDKTNPTLMKDLDGDEAEGVNTFWNQVVVTLTGSDADSGVALTEYNLDDGGWTTYTGAFSISDAGLHTLQHRVTDNAGNQYVKPEQTITIVVDDVAPTLEKLLDGEATDQWYTEDVTVTLTGSDGTEVDDSGVAKIEYKVGNAEWVTVNNTAGYEPFVVDFLITDEGTITLRHKVTDNAGTVYELDPQDIEIDKTDPTLTKTLRGSKGECGWYRTDVQVFLIGEDAGSGVALIEYNLDDAAEWTEYTGPFIISDPGCHTLQHRVTDNVGKFYVLEQQDICIDKTPPVIQGLGSPANGATVTTSEVVFDWEDAVEDCDCIGVTYNIWVYEKVPEILVYQECGIEESTITITLFDDTYYWYVNAKNCADLDSEDSVQRFFSVSIDSQAPSVTVNSPNGGENWQGGSTHTITWAATDDNTPSGDLVITLQYSTNGGTTWPEITFDEVNDGAHPWTVPSVNSSQCLVKVSTEDYAGNPASDVSDNVFTIYTPVTVLPEVAFSPEELILRVGGTGTMDIVLDKAPDGLSGYKIEASLVDGDVAEIIGVEFPSWAGMTNIPEVPADSVLIKAADLDDAVVSGDTSITLATLTIRVDLLGTSAITVVVTRMDDDSGSAMDVNPIAGQVKGSEVIPLPGLTTAPTDPDGDLLYEDLNGNGVLDFNDVVLFFDHMDWIEENEPISCFDFNDNGFIDFDDIVMLFDEV